MSEVKFSANPSAVLKALSDIQRALDRTAQSGKKFSDLDFGNPQLAKLEERMRATKAQMDAFLRVSPNSTMARGLRQSGQMGRAPWEVDWAAAFPDPQQRARALGRLAQLPQQFGGMPPGGAGYGEPQGRGGIGMPGFLPQTPMGAAGALVGLALGGSAVRAVSQGVERSQQVDASADSVLRWSTVTRDFESLRKEIAAVGQGFGVLSNEGAKLAQTYAQAAGTTEDAASGANTAAGLAVGAGMDKAGAAGRMGAMQFAGAIGGATSQREFAGMFAEVLTRGGMTARGDQVLSDLAQSVERLTTSALSPVNLTELMKFNLATFDQAKTNPALRMVGAGGLINSIENMTGYTDDTEKATFQARALWHLTQDPFMRRRMQDRGPFSRPGELVGSDDKRTLAEIMMRQAKDIDFGPNADPSFRLNYIANLLGTNTQYAEAISGIVEKFPDLDLGSLAERLKGAGLDLETVGADALPGIAKIEAARSSPDALASIRDQMIVDNAIGDEEAGALRGLEGDKLADALLKLEAQQGRSQNDFTRLTDASEELARTFDEVGKELTAAIIQLKEAVVVITNPIKAIGSRFDMIGRIMDPGEKTPWVWPGFGKVFGAATRGLPLRGGANARPDAPGAPDDDKGNPVLDFLVPPAGASTRSAAQVASERSYPYQSAIEAAAKKHGLPTWALAGLLAQESGFNPKAVGDNGASVGMGQFNKHGAAAEFGLSADQILAMPPEEQIDYAAEFLQRKLKQAGGDINKALKLYNGGGDPNYLDNVTKKARGLGLLSSQASGAFSAPGMDIDYRGNPSFQYGKSASENAKPFSGIVFHDPGSDASLDSLVKYGQRVDEARGGAFGYHFYVDRDGKIVQGAPMDKRTNHIKPNSKFGMSNSDTLGISLIGAQHGATQEQLEAARKLGEEVAKEFGIDSSRIFGHGEIQGDKRADEGVDAADAVRGSLLDDTLPKEIAPVGDPVSQRIGTSVRQDQAPPVALSLNLYQNPVTGAFHVEANREGSGSTRVAYGSGQWAHGRPRATA